VAMSCHLLCSNGFSAVRYLNTTKVRYRRSGMALDGEVSTGENVEASTATICSQCNYPARWQGLCFACFERSGLAGVLRGEREVVEQQNRQAKAEQDEVDAEAMLIRLEGEGAEWWEISERLNARGFRYRGKPWSSDMARNVYLSLTSETWED